jgi:hypothetical protein
MSAAIDGIKIAEAMALSMNNQWPAGYAGYSDRN